jgi:tetratricopeptide (TPR) repeat protein
MSSRFTADRPKTVAIALAILCVLSATPSVHGVTAVDFPSPLSGPGAAEIKKSWSKKIDRARRDFLSADFAKSRKRLNRVPEIPQSRLLELQIQVVEGNPDALSGLRSLCDDNSGYAAAWISLSIAAETAEIEIEALETAETAALLWDEPPWGARAEALYGRWVDERISTAAVLIEDGDESGAIALLQSARELDPAREDAILLTAEILMANDKNDEALALLNEIPDSPEATAFKGALAEERLDWQQAMELYSSLPAGFPGRAEGLGRAQMRWRLTLLPGYARSAMTSDAITREELAVILVSVQPQLETIPGDPVPVMSDIVDEPGQREIITVVRLGIMTTDRRAHRFYPRDPASLETVRQAIQRTRALLGMTAPVWCEEPDVVGSDCIPLPSPPDGGAVVQSILDHQPGESR